jgi:hypothetical protein
MHVDTQRIKFLFICSWYLAVAQSAEPEFAQWPMHYDRSCTMTHSAYTGYPQWPIAQKPLLCCGQKCGMTLKVEYLGYESLDLVGSIHESSKISSDYPY